jgi:cell division protein FtsI (penicillin-binding protein 3)
LNGGGAVHSGPPSETRWIGARIGLVALLLAAGFLAVSGRAVKLQVLQRAQLTRHGDDQWRRFVELRPRRGIITDRNGETLAASADAPSIAANPALLARASRRELAALAKALSTDVASLQKKAQRPAKFVWLKRRVSPAEAEAVQRLEADGVGVFQEARRYYTSKGLAAHLLGFVGDDGEGLEGIERAYDEELQGGAARVPSVRDARGRAVLGEAPAPEALLAGARVELSIDVGLQLAAEQALSRAVAQARAASGMVVAMEPRTGEVLALANAPSFNPNLPRSRGSLRNRAVLDTFEPGSTFKIFTLAGALDAGVLRADDSIDCENGAYRVGNHVIHDHKRLGHVPPARILATSSNIGAAKIGARLGRERLQKALLAFGFGERSGTEIAGEPRGAVPYPRADVSLATMSFGQGVAATPLQITTAVAAIANGGMLMKPILVRRVVDGASGAVLVQNEPSPVRRAVTRQTAATMARWMDGVVADADGTGKRARLDGWRAAGKTGTAQKADPVTRRYSADRRFSSFVGFAPADAPRVVVGVFVDEPRGEVYGGEVAAPVFREVADHALKSLGVPPSQPAGPAAAAEAVADARARGHDSREDDEAPGPPAFEEAAASATSATADGAPGVSVPTVAGLPARAAVRTLEAVNLVGEVRGTGRVVSQSPRAGQVVGRGARIRLVLAPPRS